MQVNPKQLKELLSKTIPARLSVLITGAPGVGKSDIVAQAAQDAGAELILSHPAVSDPTDYKGLPWPSTEKDEATFLPFGELARALKATEPTVWFLDDLGQAPPSVQAATMQLLLARRVNGHVLPDCVTFVAATNRRGDRAGVSGILEPVKSRFATIVELVPTIESWSEWAMGAGIPSTLIAFLRFKNGEGKGGMLSHFEATADMTNSPMPRTWAHLAKLEALKLPDAIETRAFSGAVGEGPALEYTAFRKMFASLAKVEDILKDPKGAKLPTATDQLYAIVTALAAKAEEKTMAAIVVIANRLMADGKGEFTALLMKDCIRRNDKLVFSNAFIAFSQGPGGQLMLGKVS